MNYIRTVSYLFALVTLGFAHVASAHVVVLPKEAPAESYQTFTMGVPVERETPTVSVRLVIPDGVISVRPNVKPGWKIETKKVTVAEKEQVTEITWIGGTIPTGLRDEFIFSAKTPKEGELAWKAYQTYADGMVVAWESDPGEEHGHTNHESVEGPYSITKIAKADGHGDSHGSNGHFAHDMLLPLLAIGIGLACVIELAKIKKHK
ncbi:MAG: hypothetical protein RI911_487 [Candidatus Parcubacteria bacterium]|jgi:uncharacterized protein YcnI